MPPDDKPQRKSDSKEGGEAALLPRLRSRWARYATAAALAALLLYGALFAVSRLSQSETDRLARVADERLRVEGYDLEGYGLHERSGQGTAQQEGAAAASNVNQRYLQGLRLLRDAHVSTLGLFPRYDAAPLRRAERELEAVAKAAEPGAFVQLEALFFLGKARLARGDRAAATRAFRKVAAGGGRLAPEAQRILTRLYEDAAYDGPPSRE